MRQAIRQAEAEAALGDKGDVVDGESPLCSSPVLNFGFRFRLRPSIHTPPSFIPSSIISLALSLACLFVCF